MNIKGPILKHGISVMDVYAEYVELKDAKNYLRMITTNKP